jgi:hypothetical protein
MAQVWVSKVFSGSSAEPIVWDKLLTVFDSIYGEDTRELRSYPHTYHHVNAAWIDKKGNEHPSSSLEELREAYEKHLTYEVRFSGWRQDGRPCKFSYFPGWSPPTAEAFIQFTENTIKPVVDILNEVFPIQRQIIFLSWSGARAKAVAKCIAPIIQSRLPAGVRVFFSETDIFTGDNPLKTMLDDNLLPAIVQVPILTEVSYTRPWLVWETAAAWALQKHVIPLFVNVTAHKVGAPITSLKQGVRIDKDGDLDRLIVSIVEKVGGDTPTSLSVEEVQEITDAVSTEDS